METIDPLSLGLLKRVSKVDHRLEEVPTDENAAEGEEGLMDARPSLITEGETSESMKPGQCAFDDPSCPPEAAAVRRPARRQLRSNPPLVQGVAMRLGVVPAILCLLKNPFLLIPLILQATAAAAGIPTPCGRCGQPDRKSVV